MRHARVRGHRCPPRCDRPEDHIDNPKDYADNLDATQYDPRLRRPVDERVELAIDPRTGLKNYIANEQAGIMTLPCT
jgi:hypothetical protein